MSLTVASSSWVCCAATLEKPTQAKWAPTKKSLLYSAKGEVYLVHGLECPIEISMFWRNHMFDKHKKSFQYPHSQEITSRGQATGPCKLLWSGRGDACRLHYQGAKPKIRSAVGESRTILYEPLKNTWTCRICRGFTCRGQGFWVLIVHRCWESLLINAWPASSIGCPCVQLDSLKEERGGGVFFLVKDVAERT